MERSLALHETLKIHEMLNFKTACMINDYLEVRSAEGMPDLADSTIALDFLLAAKTGVRNCDLHNQKLLVLKYEMFYAIN